jgi:N-acetylmuramoyl-L-alanine amidase
MKRWLRSSVGFLIFVLSDVSLATTTIQGVRLWPSPDGTRVVFDLKGPIQHEKTHKSDFFSPPWVIIDLKVTDFAFDLTKLKLHNTGIKKITKKRERPGWVRVIFDLEKSLKPTSFTLPPNQQYGHRLVLDLEKGTEEEQWQLALSEADKTLPSPQKSQAFSNARPFKGVVGNQKDISFQEKLHRPTSLKNKIQGNIQINPTSLHSNPLPTMKTTEKRPFIVAIDPGHGGEDPGAVGKSGTQEKDVVLAISKYLKGYIDQERGMHAILVRSGDYYIGLHERVARARKQKADLFVSVHADAFHDKRADGISVFTLSERGSSSAAAKWLADHENRSDLIGGVQLKNKNKVLASVLLDLSQSASKEEGLQAANKILCSLKQVAPLHKKQVEQAGFAVLKAPDIPSLLIETGFISHPGTEQKLRSAEHQKKIAKAIMLGIRHYVVKKSR